jgi:hypothetical protein
MDIEYSFEQKEKLAKHIQKLKKKQHFIDIQNIIVTQNPDINITTNQSGHFMYFQNLKTETYITIEKYIKKVNMKKYLSEYSDNTDTQNLHINSEKIPGDIKKYSSEIEPFSDNPRLKYSNKEKNLIKRKNYDEQINNQEVEYSTTLDNEINNIHQNIDDAKKIFVKRKTNPKDKKGKLNSYEADTTITLT